MYIGPAAGGGHAGIPLCSTAGDFWLPWRTAPAAALFVSVPAAGLPGAAHDPVVS